MYVGLYVCAQVHRWALRPLLGGAPICEYRLLGARGYRLFDEGVRLKPFWLSDHTPESRSVEPYRHEAHRLRRDGFHV